MYALYQDVKEFYQKKIDALNVKLEPDDEDRAEAEGENENENENEDDLGSEADEKNPGDQVRRGTDKDQKEYDGLKAEEKGVSDKVGNISRLEHMSMKVAVKDDVMVESEPLDDIEVIGEEPRKVQEVVAVAGDGNHEDDKNAFERRDASQPEISIIQRPPTEERKLTIESQNNFVKEVKARRSRRRQETRKFK